MTLHKELRCSGIGSHIDTDMAHDAKEAEEDERIAEKFHTTEESRDLRVRLLFFNPYHAEKKDGEKSHDCIDREEDTPLKAEGRNDGSCAPHRDVWCHERRDCLHELAEGEGRGQFVATDDVADQRIERGLPCQR